NININCLILKTEMILLGIIDSQNDCGVCLLKDGEVISALNEERVVRQKLIGGFPHQSLKKILEINKLSYNDIDKIIVSGFCTPPVFARYFRFLQKAEYDVRKNKKIKITKKLSDIAQGKLRIQTSKPKSWFGLLEKPLLKPVIRKELPKGLKNKEIIFVNHHLCHAAGAYYTQEKKKVLAITADGCGDGVSLTINICDNNKITRIFEVKAKHSYGWFYGLITMALGFQWHKHEGKVTGLAARGNADNVKIKFPFVSENGGTVYKGSHMPNDIKKMISSYSMEDISAWVQKGLEKHMIKTARYWVKKTKIGDVVLAGGLFANVKLNEMIHEIPEVTSVYVFPHMGDGGLAAGACLEHVKPTPKKIKTLYLGGEYTDKEIKVSLDKSGLKFRKSKNIEKEIAELLSQGKVIARFNGAMEYGPRALGNRSILYQTTDPSVNNWLNKKLKRTEFMPFAPATLWEERKKCYLGLEGAETTAKYMTITFNCTTKMKKQSPGVVHIDGTARPQLVKKEDNESFYKIIKEYHKITGIPSIINTSFNVHEEPIVMTPLDAIRAFKQSKLDHLAIGKYLI
ncbi:carbamoyltransferase C-terminal domain-containing protein, partial [Bacteroidota bacterium]